MDGIVIILLLLINTILAVLVFVSPLILAAFLFLLLRKCNVGKSAAVTSSMATISLLVLWPLSGLLELSNKCDEILDQSVNLVSTEPLNYIFVDGPGMWWLNDIVNVERQEPTNSSLFWRMETNNKRIRNISESNLQSYYSIKIEHPLPSDFIDRYLTTAVISIVERKSKNTIYRIQEHAWGGGMAGYYIAALTKLNPFNSDNKYISNCYAGNQIGIYRGNSKERQLSYRSADKKLAEKLFLFSNNIKI